MERRGAQPPQVGASLPRMAHPERDKGLPGPGEQLHRRVPRHHRDPPRRGADQVPGLSRHPHRPAQPRALRRTAGPGLAQAERHGRGLAVVFLDLDHFKHINDSLGHSMGDLLLQAVAQRLRACLREVDTVARLGGDEFMPSCPTWTTPGAARQVAGAYSWRPWPSPSTWATRSCSSPPAWASPSFPTTARDARDPGQERRHGHVPRQGAGAQQHPALHPGHEQQVPKQRLTLEQQPAPGPGGDEFVVHYQPKLDLAAGRIVGMEALVRWQRPEDQLVSPAEFIPLAEETGLILPMGERVLRMACQPPSPLAPARPPRSDRGGQPLRPPILARGPGGDGAQRSWQDSGLPPRLLELEITESTMMTNVEPAMPTMTALRDLGVQLSLDDFGTGYSSLFYLKQFPIERPQDRQSPSCATCPYTDDAAIVQAHHPMAHSLQAAGGGRGRGDPHPNGPFARVGLRLHPGLPAQPPTAQPGDGPLPGGRALAGTLELAAVCRRVRPLLPPFVTQSLPNFHAPETPRLAGSCIYRATECYRYLM